MAINVGLCLPMVCSVRMLEPILNHLIQQKFNNVTAKVNENDCQIEDSTFELRTIDVIAM